MRRTTARTRARSSRSRRSSSRRIAIPPDARVLDIGCGDGKVTALIRVAVGDRVRPVAGDGRAGGARAPECTFVVADVRELPFADAFDVAVSFTALHWVVDGHVEALAAVRPRARAGRPLPRAVPRRRQHGGARRAAVEVSARPAWRDAFAGFRFPWLMPSLRGLPADGRGVGPRDRAARAGAARRRARGRTRVSRAGCGRRGCRTPTACRRTAVPAWIDEVVGLYAERMPPDAAGPSARAVGAPRAGSRRPSGLTRRTAHSVTPAARETCHERRVTALDGSDPARPCHPRKFGVRHRIAPGHRHARTRARRSRETRAPHGSGQTPRGTVPPTQIGARH